MITQPMKACDFDEKYARFPLVILPKVDGVRGYNSGGFALARSGEPYANRFTVEAYSCPALDGADWETVAGPITDASLCRNTTSALNTIEGEPFTQIFVFDWLNEDTRDMGYLQRLDYLCKWIPKLHERNEWYAQHVRAMPYQIVHNVEEMYSIHQSWCNMGFEGSIVRDPEGKYKFGRATAKELGYARIKPWAHDEIVVTDVEEGQANNNTLEADAHGYAKRSTHAENMAPNGMVGAIYGDTVKDIVVNGGKKVIPAGTRVKVAAGKLPHENRKYYFEHQDEIIGELVKFQHFPHGVKDKLRFPTFQCFRMPQDM